MKMQANGMAVRIFLLTLLVTAGAASTARAQFGSSSLSGGGKKLYLGVGLMAYSMSRFSEDASGGHSILGRKYWDLGLSLQLDTGLIRILPTLAYTLLGRTTDDQNSSRLLTFTVPGLIGLTESVDLKFGPGVLWYSQGGSGGRVTLPNGSSTRDYHAADRSYVTRLFLLDLGAAYRVSDFKFDFDVLVVDAFTSRRAINGAFHVGYAIF